MIRRLASPDSGSRPFLRLSLIACLFLFAGVAFGETEMSQRQVAALDRVTILKIANFLIFAAGLGYYLFRNAPRFFNARSSDIRKAIEEATGLKLEADYRYSEIDRKMASLAEEVRRIRQEAQRELEREHARFRQESQAEIEHIHHNVLNEIDALRKQGVNQVRRHAAQLALGIAERRLTERFRGPESDDTIHDFVNLVQGSKN
jgi:F-type H+-transporting ATPase subunit b